MTTASPKIRTLVVDDEPVARARMRSLLQDEQDIEIIGEYQSGQEAMSAIEHTSPDLVFLDIQMPQMDGLQLARALGDRMPAVVFVTAYASTLFARSKSTRSTTCSSRSAPSASRRR